jgi:hypothetical protein
MNRLQEMVLEGTSQIYRETKNDTVACGKARKNMWVKDSWNQEGTFNN